MDCTVRGLLALAVMLVVSGGSIFGQNAEGGAAGAGAETVASPPASWNVNQSLAAFERSTQLMESTGILVPNLSRAAEPLLETARQTVANLNANGQHRNLVFIHRLLKSVQTYLQLLDALEKPYPMPETAARQIQQLRDIAVQLEALQLHLMEQGEVSLRGADRDNLARYREANQRLPRPNAKLPRVVFLGDSITDSWRLEEYFPGNDFVNRGISGQTTGQMLGRFKQDVIDLQPAVLVILAGTNDIGRGVAQHVIESNLSLMFDLADKHRIKVILCTLLPVSDYAKERGVRFVQTERRPPARIKMVNDWLKVTARSRRYRLVDYHLVMADGEGFLKQDSSDDGLHPNAEGYRAMSNHILSAIRDVARGK
jgi:lysophospholipase L1-like esterase